ncbi:MAG: hypothetical protein JNK46_18750 [Methylobacteriaceae bacterium]|nr:hypothetical protein [Methylobacteriaceae bacterium]
MTGQVAQALDRREATRLRRAALAAVVLLAAAGGLLWAKFGPTLFFDLLNVTLNCF